MKMPSLACVYQKGASCRSSDSIVGSYFTGACAEQTPHIAKTKLTTNPKTPSLRIISTLFHRCYLFLLEKTMCSSAAAHNTVRAVAGKAISNIKIHNLHGIPTNSTSNIGIPHQIAMYRRRWAKVRFFPVLEISRGNLIDTLLTHWRRQRLFLHCMPVQAHRNWFRPQNKIGASAPEVLLFYKHPSRLKPRTNSPLSAS